MFVSAASTIPESRFGDCKITIKLCLRGADLLLNLIKYAWYDYACRFSCSFKKSLDDTENRFSLLMQNS